MYIARNLNEKNKKKLKTKAGKGENLSRKQGIIKNLR
jgi:hypothetical protein